MEIACTLQPGVGRQELENAIFNRDLATPAILVGPETKSAATSVSGTVPLSNCVRRIKDAGTSRLANGCKMAVAYSKSAGKIALLASLSLTQRLMLLNAKSIRQH